MYTMIRRYGGVDRGALEDALGRVETELAPRLRASPGFVRAYVLAEGDAVYSVTVYDDRRTAEAAAGEAGEWARRNLAGLATSVDEVASGDLVLEIA
jgi:hypothetical protein